MNRSALLILVLIFPLVGCIKGPAPRADKWEYPLAGMNLKSEKALHDLTKFNNNKVPILVSKNTKGFVEIKKNFQKWLSILGSADAEAANDPKIAANSMLAILKRNLPNDYYVISDISSAKQSDLVIVVDRWGDYILHPFAGYEMPNKAGMYLINMRTQSLLFDATAEYSLACHPASMLSPTGILDAYQKCAIDIDNALYSKIESDFKVALQSPAYNQDNGGDKYREVLESGSDAQLYSLALSLQQAGNNVMASKVYQAVVQRFPQSPYAAKAIEQQERLNRAGN